MGDGVVNIHNLSEKVGAGVTALVLFSAIFASPERSSRFPTFFLLWVLSSLIGCWASLDGVFRSRVLAEI